MTGAELISRLLAEEGKEEEEQREGGQGVAGAVDSEAEQRAKQGIMQYGCDHYKRRCKIRAPCCFEVFGCRHCHNKVKNMEEPNPDKQHDIDRFAIQQVTCSLCRHEQPVQQTCCNCGVRMGEYFCAICKFYDDDTSKQQFHCNQCGICRVGGRENYFHCQRCGACYPNAMRGNHTCVNDALRHDCLVCFEHLFDSVDPSIVLRCGHTIHQKCWGQVPAYLKVRCLLCGTSLSTSNQNRSSTVQH